MSNPSRELPHDIAAEQAVLGAILVNNNALDRVSGILDATAFNEPLHAEIFDVISRLISTGKTATPVTMRAHFEQHPPITDQMTAVQYLGILAAKSPMFGIKDHAEAVYKTAVRRELIAIAYDMANAAYDGSIDASPVEQIAQAETRLYELTKTAPNERAETSLANAMDRAVAAANDARQRGGALAGLSTGLEPLDRRLGGLASTALIILAGRPGIGKTALATNVAYAVASTGVPVGFFSMEMSDVELAQRILSEQTGLTAGAMRSGRLSEDDFRLMMGVQQSKGHLPLIIDQSGGLTLAQLASRARRMKRKNGIGLLVIDYLQLMGGSTYRTQNRTQELTEITTGLKALAKELAMPIIALSQLNRSVEMRPNKRPQLSDLRESGSIEQDADIVMFVYRDDYYLEREKPDNHGPAYQEWQAKLEAASGKAEVIVAKHRHGQTGTVDLRFDGATTSFREPQKEGWS
jgi:replicative DNA helicase